MCVLYDYRYGIFVCKCVSVSECKLCDIIYVVVQRAKRKTAVAILVPQFSYFNFHMNFSCKLSVYIYICFLCMKIENKFYSILFYSICPIFLSPQQRYDMTFYHGTNIS